MPLNIIPPFVLIYLTLCGVAGFFGRRRRIGFWGFFFLSIMATPFATALFIYFSAPARPRRRRAPGRQ
jgi:hypothetical protein